MATLLARSLNTALIAAFIMLCPAAEPACAENFALISPSAVAALSAEKASPEGKYAIRKADEGLNRQPAPMSHITIAGVLPHHDLYDQSKASIEDLALMRDFAIAYRLTDDPKYLSAVRTFLSAWVDTYRGDLNPIDDSNFYPMFLASDLCRANLPRDLNERVDKWLRALAEGYLEAVSKSEDVNNWQSHRINLATLAAFALGDKKLIDESHAAFERQIARNISSDGSVWDFSKRDALHYVAYDLEPLLMASFAAQTHGQNWFNYQSPSGSSIRMALQWLAPYATGEKSHREFAHTTIAFDVQRAHAGEAGFSGLWDPKGAIETYAFATALDPEIQTTLHQIEAHTGAKTPYWIQLLLLDK